MSKTWVIDNNRTNDILVDELTTLLLNLSNNKIDQEVAYSLSKLNLDKIDLYNPFLTHKGLSWIANQILIKQI